MASSTTDQQEALQRLSDILDRLRNECPWDREQTLKSLRYLSIEEVYELSEAIVAVGEHPDDARRYDDLKKELGDILLHIYFYAKIAADGGHFSLTDVANAVCDKLVSRHPHIFAGGEQLPWERVKMREGRTSVLEGVPQSLPPLVKSVRMQEKAEGIGYGEPTLADQPLTTADTTNNIFADEKTFGDALLRLLHEAHRHGINADDALTAANHRYQQRVEEWERTHKR
ncbi:MAG: nucleoside triphosphate pyrophosphohydrolase [Bacteroidales bacterium]|nr:nucleoside triphosphate pyrophosphohydrolase [Bacteroidales bacterium]